MCVQQLQGEDVKSKGQGLPTQQQLGLWRLFETQTGKGATCAVHSGNIVALQECSSCPAAHWITSLD